jgi:bifunctional ADP-heptose synthase (sugar kinase/adenylyltransferase)
MVVGSDWKGKKVIGAEYAKEVVYFKRIKEFSTTKILSNDKSK